MSGNPKHRPLGTKYTPAPSAFADAIRPSRGQPSPEWMSDPRKLPKHPPGKKPKEPPP